MDRDSQSIAVDARRYAFPPAPEALHFAVRTSAVSAPASPAAARDVDDGGSFVVSVRTGSPLRHDLMLSVEEYAALIGCLKQIDDLPAGEYALRARQEREAYEALGRVRRTIAGMCRDRGLD